MAIEAAIDATSVARVVPGRVASGVAPLLTLTAEPTQEGVAVDGGRRPAPLVPVEQRQIPIKGAELEAREAEARKSGATTGATPRETVVPVSSAQIGPSSRVVPARTSDAKEKAKEVGATSRAVVVPAGARDTNGPPRRVPATVVPPRTPGFSPALLRVIDGPLP